MQAKEEGSRGGSASGLRHVFGPVVSRRLGRSLGIDPLPSKTCNWNCVYCQLGRTAPLMTRRASYVPPRAVLREVEVALSGEGGEGIDWITFVGSGETLLHSELGRMLRATKARTKLPVAVITNGSLLSLPEVRQAVSPADAVLPSLDAGTPSLFKRINRPHPGIPFQEHLLGLEAFRRQYSGELLLEVMLVRGLNDTPKALSDLAAAVRRVRPDAIHLSSPHRPPAEPWVKPADPEGLMRATSALGSAAKVLHLAEDVIVLGTPDSAMDALVAVLGRHPMSEVQLRRALSEWPAGEASRFLASLERSPRVRKVVRHGGTFWVSGGARFPPERRSEDAGSEISFGPLLPEDGAEPS